MKNARLKQLNFEHILRYDNQELYNRGAQSRYCPPLKCNGFCTKCDNNQLLGKSGEIIPMMSNGCHSDDYTNVLGDIREKIKAESIQAYEHPVMFILESPGGSWDSGDKQEYNGYIKRPPTKHYYWMPHNIKMWPSNSWKKPKTKGEYFGDYFAYLMVKHGLVNVYITDVVKCSWNGSYSQTTLKNCVESFLNNEIVIFTPQILFCFSRKVHNFISATFPEVPSVYLYHPSAINLAMRHKTTSETMACKTDYIIAQSIRDAPNQCTGHLRRR